MTKRTVALRKVSLGFVHFDSRIHHAGSLEVNHPVHLSEDGASAFIPFCAYQSDLVVADHPQRIQGISYPVCSSFQQTILEGQLCYELKLNRSSGQGKDNELMLLLDYNEDRSLETSSNNKDGNLSSDQTLNFDTARPLWNFLK